MSAAMTKKQAPSTHQAQDSPSDDTVREEDAVASLGGFAVSYASAPLALEAQFVDLPPMLSIDLTGKRAFIAGVADDGGFGFAIAKSLAEAGA
jgi:hypothetical protein